MGVGAFSLRFIPEAYDVQNIFIATTGLFTNTSQNGPYRGAGRPEAAYFTERLLEHAARAIGMDGAEIRRRNLIAPDKLPYSTPTFWTYDSGEFGRLLDKCVESSDPKGFAARRKDSEKHGKLRGRAVSYYIEFGGIFNDRMDLQVRSRRHHHDLRRHPFARAGPRRDRVRPDRPRPARPAVRRDRLRPGRHRQDRDGPAPGTYGARSAQSSAAARSSSPADGIIEKGKGMASALMEADTADIEFKEGRYRVAGTDKVGRAHRRRQGASTRRWAR